MRNLVKNVKPLNMNKDAKRVLTRILDKNPNRNLSKIPENMCKAMRRIMTK